MRPGQNAKRMRGRNNNRKGPNPLTRTYESNGPDVKIRGTAHHIAEKYLQLARDAQSSGDTVAAESYLQHAEHYFRLIAAAQLAQQQVQYGYQRPPGETADGEESDEDDDFGGLPDRFASPIERQPQPSLPNQAQPTYGNGPQPYQDRQPFNGERPHNGDRPHPTGQAGGERQDRGPRPERPFQDRNYQGQRDNRQGRDQRPNYRTDYRADADQRVNREPVVPVRLPAPDGEPVNGLPAFITAPVRITPVTPDEPVETTIEAAVEVGPVPAVDAGEESGRFPLRPRRRRRGRPGQDAGPSDLGEATDPGEVPVGD
jgi:hypothetical protein